VRDGAGGVSRDGTEGLTCDLHMQCSTEELGLDPRCSREQSITFKIISFFSLLNIFNR
jgi:hypothetical protein